ncbi:class I SAM-dependent methyltransferase [Pseudarthrobacter sp. J47]|uniref:class I SAM-dependent methyltransferase n=1 Tax=Pseudarthrobacter sp. J47 TaxID=3116482 RepID=UPI003CC5CBE0
MSASQRQLFNQLIAEADAAHLEGWDFGFLNGRAVSTPLPWDYLGAASALVAASYRALDVDTGGGEIFAALKPPRGSVAVEPYPPNLTISAQRLQPLGVKVRERITDRLPVSDESFDLVLNRHGYMNLNEFSRALRPGGTLLTQQVGAKNDIEFNKALGIPESNTPGAPLSTHDLRNNVRAAGFENCHVSEATVSTRFLDIGAVVFQLRAVPWQAPGFRSDTHRDQLWRIHNHIVQTGSFQVCSQRFLIKADKPDKPR